MEVSKSTHNLFNALRHSGVDQNPCLKHVPPVEVDTALHRYDGLDLKYTREIEVINKEKSASTDSIRSLVLQQYNVVGVLAIILFSILLLASCDKKHESAKAPNPASQQADVLAPSPSQPASQIAIPPEPPFIAEAIEEIPREYTFFEKLAQAALERTTHDVTYDGRYQKIAYPMGDVPDSTGVCTDVVIRSYRQLGIDLQQLLHEDISKHFKKYPNQKRWGLTRPDTNIDHRRVPNLRVFFTRFGSSLPVTDQAEDYLPGDLVTWKLNEKMVHIGIVAEEVSYTHPTRHLIIHNIGSGPELGDILFDYEITGHYRYSPNEEEI